MILLIQQVTLQHNSKTSPSSLSHCTHILSAKARAIQFYFLRRKNIINDTEQKTKFTLLIYMLSFDIKHTMHKNNERLTMYGFLSLVRQIHTSFVNVSI